MSRLLAVARATFAEAIRHRILYLLGVFALALIVGSRLLSLITVGEPEKIIKDVGLSAINIFGLLVALFVGVGIIFRELERRTVQVTLAAPVARWEYLLGKYCGLAGAISLNAALMTLALVVMLVLRGAFDAPILVAAFMLWIELLFLTAAAVFFSSFSTPIFSALFTAATYVVGHLAWSLPLLERKLGRGLWRTVTHAVYLLIPDLEYGDVRALAVHGAPIPAGRVVWGSVYELSYAAILLAIACLAFRRRDLT